MINYRKVKGAAADIKWCFGAVTALLIISFLYSRGLNSTASPGSPIFEASYPTIPNIVHFVHLVPEYEHSELHFSFAQFIAVYSALYYLKPDKIYIHTNSDKQILDTAKNSTDPYLKIIANLPSVVFNYQVPPNRTTSGLPIRNLAHRADFLRTKMLKEHGGLYLDHDVYVLKDMSPLRHMGFENVVGMQKNNEICNAVLLCAPGNEMIVSYDILEDSVFDGSWDAHSVLLLTTIHAEYSARENSVLSLPQHAFFPGSWEKIDLARMYEVHRDRGFPVVLQNHDTRNQSDFIASFQPWLPRTWQRDWRASYTMHGWNSALRHFTPEELGMVFGIYGGITLEYVLARTSNFARAVFPAVDHAVMNGVLGSETRSSILAAGLI